MKCHVMAVYLHHLWTDMGRKTLLQGMVCSNGQCRHYQAAPAPARRSAPTGRSTCLAKSSGRVISRSAAARRITHATDMMMCWLHRLWHLLTLQSRQDVT